ncbi:MAG: hypothetical protein U1E65_29005 [Myxococcota bacterium]
MHVRSAHHDDWRLIDRRIQGLAAQQGRLDLELGQWLLAAKRVRVHNHLGFGSFSEYVTRRLGYNAKSALDRLRVAEALERLPKLRGLLRRGERSWSALREITRRATPETKDAWIARTEGKTCARSSAWRRQSRTARARTQPIASLSNYLPPTMPTSSRPPSTPGVRSDPRPRSRRWSWRWCTGSSGSAGSRSRGTRPR